MFERLRTDGDAEVNRLIGEVETLFLDFKLSKSPMTRPDRENLAEALSGFANADGGVVVWGVDCRRDPKTDEDVARDKKPIHGLKLFMSDLNRRTSEVIRPGVTGVEHLGISVAGVEDTGYAVTYVPRSEGGPHMAVATKNQYRYYCRIGGSFLKMEHYMVADRFQRRPQPKLELWYRLLDGKPTLGEKKISPGQILMTVGIRNVGKGMALYPALVLHKDGNFHLQGLFRNEDPAFSRRSTDRKYLFLGGVKEVVYPGTDVEVATAVVRAGGPASEGLDLTITHELYCDGFSYAGEAVIPGAAMAEKRKQIWGT